MAAATNSSLGFGTISNFVVTLWFKQNSMMATNANVGPRLFVLGEGTPADAGATNSVGLKFQTANQLYFQLGGVTATATFTNPLPTNTWLFIAAAYDGAAVTMYQGSETAPATLVSTSPASTNLYFGGSGELTVGNRQNLQRSFDGWLADFRFYSGVGDSNFVEGVRQQAINPPPPPAIQRSASSLLLNWPYGVLQSALSATGSWADVPGASSPFTVTPVGQQQFFRIREP
jgi:hypothetical protein